MTTLLVVDDEKNLVDLIRSYAIRDGYTVLTAYDGRAALDIARSARPDLIVLDLMLPGLNGIDVCRQLRQFSDAYVIMLTARSEEIDTIVGLAVGADDYLTKPFSPRELMARIQAMLRRPRSMAATSELAAPAPRHVGDVVIDEVGYTVTRDGTDIPFTHREFALFALLARYPGRVFTRAQLLDHVWGSDYYDAHVVEVHIGNVRKKLEGSRVTITTLRGLGYRLLVRGEP